MRKCFIIIIISLILFTDCKITFEKIETSNQIEDTSFVNVRRLDSIFKGYKVHKIIEE